MINKFYKLILLLFVFIILFSSPIVSQEQVIQNRYTGDNSGNKENSVNKEDTNNQQKINIAILEPKDTNDKLLAMKAPDGKKYFYHPAPLGSTTSVTNQSGDVVDYIQYLPFGEIYQGSENTSRFLFTSKELDKDTDFYYYGTRYYDPKFSHFVQPDPFIADVYNPQSLNRYSYVLNNPYKYVDPSGNTPWDVVDVGLFILDLKTVSENPSLENVGWATLSAVSLIPILPNVAGYVRYGDKAVDVAKNLNKVESVGEAGLKSFTKGNFRENVGRLTRSELTKAEEAHHIFSQAPDLAKKFEGKINIHDPRFGAVVDKTAHKKFSNQYNKEWREFFEKNQNPTREQILQKGQELSKRYGYKTNYKIDSQNIQKQQSQKRDS